MEFIRQQSLSLRDYLVIFMYGLIVLVSLFGNILVCKVILFKQTMRRRTTHIFIANLTISDLLMTIFTIPMNTARQILDNWPFGEFCCKLVPFVQAISVYVSALSMTMIAIDRFQALARPLEPRIIHQMPKWFWIMLIWTVASLLSIPYSIFNHVVDVFTMHSIRVSEPLYRCKAIYPGNDPTYYERLITCLAFATQFCIPMLIVAFCYIAIGMKISKRACIGETTTEQAQTHLNTKRKTIKMLICVMATFVICWLPYNLLFIIEDFFHINFSLTIHYLAHWLAMSSICYNPFIYFWLNHGYRQGILNILTCCCRKWRPHVTIEMNEAMSEIETIRPNNNTFRRQNYENRQNVLLINQHRHKDNNNNNKYNNVYTHKHTIIKIVPSSNQTEVTSLTVKNYGNSYSEDNVSSRCNNINNSDNIGDDEDDDDDDNDDDERE